MKVGDRVRFIADMDIFSCDTIIRAGETGTIESIEGQGQLIGVLMDEHHPNLCDAEWPDNVAYCDSEIQPHADLIQVIA